MTSEDDSFIRSTLAACKYREPDKTRRELLDVCKQYRGLKPVKEVYVFNNGVQKSLLALRGTIPVNYKGNYYNIPVLIWILDTHPYNAPMVYVKPTPEMRIKVSRHVDHIGKVYLPYLHDWKNGQSEVMILIQVMIMCFQEQPPVYSVGPSQSPTQPLSPPTMPYPPYSYATPYPPNPLQTSMPSPSPILSPPPSSVVQPFSKRPSLLTAAEEKLRRRLEDVYLANEIEIRTGQQLKEGQERLEVMVNKLAQEKGVLENNITACQNEIAQIDEKLADHANQEQEANIDDAIQATTPLYKQIVNTFAEEAAMEDTIYYIGDALRNGKIDLEQFQRQIRILARKQFMLRALLHKCRQKAGLAG